MDYKYCDYKGRYVNNAKEYLNAIRNNCFNIAYDYRNRKNQCYQPLLYIQSLNFPYSSPSIFVYYNYKL